MTRLKCFSVVLLTFGLSEALVGQRPNIVLVLTDNQDLLLGGMTPMRHTRRLIEEQGASDEQGIFIHTNQTQLFLQGVFSGLFFSTCL